MENRKKPADQTGPPSNIFAFDQAKQVLMNTSLGTRVMVLDTEFYQAFIANLTPVFKSGTQVFLYHMGLAYGNLLGTRILEIGRDAPPTPDAYLRRYSSLAMGKFEWPNLASLLGRGPVGIRIALSDSFFAKALGRTGQAECHIVRGLLEGTAKSVLGSEYSCAEEKCLSKGDERCEFYLTPVKSS